MKFTNDIKKEVMEFTNNKGTNIILDINGLLKEKNILLLDLDGLNKAVLKYMLKMIKLVKTYMTICLNMVKNLMLKQDVQI